MSESCVSCQKFMRCSKPKTEICNKFKPWTNTQLDLLTMFSDNGEIPQHIDLGPKGPVPFDAEEEAHLEASLHKMLNDALSPANAIPPDLQFDDRDLKHYPNFYEFCMDPNGLDQPPLPKQLVIYTHLFGEWCPHCTHESFHDIRDWPTDSPVQDAKDKVQFLEYGVCKKCGATRSEMIEQGLLQPYQEIALCLGQRSGKSIGVTLSASYCLHRLIKLQNPTKVYNLTKNTNLTGTFVGITFKRAVDLLFQPITSLISKSKWFQCIEENEPVTLSDGSTKKIKHVVVGDEVKTLEGSSVVDATVCNGSKECFEVETESGKILTATAEHRVRCLAPNGKSLIWKYVSDITEDDYVVEE